jgi:hypothetical protein
MKSILAVLLLFSFPLVSPAQILLEHIYPWPNIQRLQVPGVGELYGYTRSTLGADTIFWYDADHQPFSKISTNVQVQKLIEASTNFFDSDPGIECIVQGSLLQFNILDDDGSSLAGPLYPEPIFFTVNDQKKLLSNKLVRTVPDFGLEFSFFNARSAVDRVYLENEGYKFYFINQDGDLEFLNEDYTHFSTLQTNFPTDCPLDFTVRVWGKYRLNTNDDIDWETNHPEDCAPSPTGSYLLRKFYSGVTPLSYAIGNGAFSYRVSTLLPDEHPGLAEAKLWVQRDFASGFGPHALVQDIATGQTEHFFDGLWIFQNSDATGLKYIRQHINIGSTLILQPDYSVWKDFSFPDSLSTFAPLYIGEAIFDGDAASGEMLGNPGYNFSSPQNSRLEIRREDQTLLFQLDSLSSAEVSLLPGLANKLFVRRHTPTYFTNETRVYSLPSSTPLSAGQHVKGPAADFRAFPNPFTESITVETSSPLNAVLETALFDAQSRMVWRQHHPPARERLEIGGLEHLSPGLYWLRLTAGGAVGSRELVKIGR